MALMINKPNSYYSIVPYTEPVETEPEQLRRKLAHRKFRRKQQLKAVILWTIRCVLIPMLLLGDYKLVLYADGDLNIGVWFGVITGMLMIFVYDLTEID